VIEIIRKLVATLDSYFSLPSKFKSNPRNLVQSTIFHLDAEDPARNG
jgi:hypothetical protein